MSYQILYTKRAVKDIRKLDSVAKKRLKKQIEKLAQNPFKFAVRLKDKRLGEYRFRIGNYRVIFDIDKNKLIILRVAHRKEVYNKQ